MNAIEQEIIEKFHQLPSDAKQRVLTFIEQDVASEGKPTEAAFDYAAWADAVETLRQEIRTRQNDMLPPIDVTGMLRNIRDGEDE